MSTAVTLLTCLRAAGVRLFCRGESLDYDAPASVLTPALIGELRTHKVEILKPLREPANGVPAAPITCDVDHELHIVVQDLYAEGRAAGMAKPVKWAARRLKLKPSSVIRIMDGGRL